MPKIKHIAIATQDSKKTAQFYIDVFGMKQIAELDIPQARGFYLSDGYINVAILDFKNEEAAGAERGVEWSGIHHFGFEVESLEEIAEKMEAAGAKPREDLNNSMKQVFNNQEPAHGYPEVKYGGPDGVVVDVSATGWVGTRGLD